MSGQKPREIAVRILERRERGEDFVENIAEKELALANLSAQDRGLAIELAYGCVRWMRTLDFLIDRKTQGRQQKPTLRILLRLGLYQLFFLDRVPDHAAVHETVELAKRLGCGPQAGFINAILRAYLREAQTPPSPRGEGPSEVRSSGFSQQSATPTTAAPDQLKASADHTLSSPAFKRLPLLRELESTHPATAYSHPDWLYQRWSSRWGAENTLALLKINNTPPPTFARANTLRGTIDDLTAAWQTEGVNFKAHQFNFDLNGPSVGRTGVSPVPLGVSPGAASLLVFELLNHPPLATLPSFQRGLFYLQDPSTLLAPIALAARPGETILDMCAAPGGKTTYIAQLTSNQAIIIAEDIQPARLALVQENATRLGAKIQIASELRSQITGPKASLSQTAGPKGRSSSSPGQSEAPPWVASPQNPSPERATQSPPTPNAKFSMINDQSSMNPSLKFDRILIDAPCSNTGVLRRRVDLRWRLRETELTRFAATQLKLLEQAAARLKPTGTILYSTCSLEPEENQNLIQKFLSSHSDFRLDLEQELLPFRDAVDGAYIARLNRERS